MREENSSFSHQVYFHVNDQPSRQLWQVNNNHMYTSARKREREGQEFPPNVQTYNTHIHTLRVSIKEERIRSQGKDHHKDKQIQVQLNPPASSMKLQVEKRRRRRRRREYKEKKKKKKEK